MSELDVLQKAEKSGVAFVVGTPALGGQESHVLTAQEIVAYMEDPVSVQAACMGLTSAEYQEYLASQGSVFCCATTKGNKPCRNSIVGATLLPPAQWKKVWAEKGYCAVHGG
jgi:hypothetical protein